MACTGPGPAVHTPVHVGARRHSHRVDSTLLYDSGVDYKNQFSTKFFVLQKWQRRTLGRRKSLVVIRPRVLCSPR